MAEEQEPITPSFIPYKAVLVRDCIRIPKRLLRSGKLSTGEAVLWGILSDYALFDGDCYPTIEELAKATKLSERSVNRHITALIQKGFLRIKPRSKSTRSRRSNSYELLQHPVFDPVVKTQPNSANSAQIECQSGTSTSANLASKREENKDKKTTTTTRESKVNAARQDDLKKGGCGFSLSDEELHYIQLQVEYTAANGELRRPASRLERALKRKAAAGELDRSDYPDLKRWKSAQSAPHIAVERPVLRDKEALLGKVAAKNQEACKWWNALEASHPARCDEKPSLMAEGFWIRNQFQKYTQSEEMKHVG
jgi:DNA-binding transcriptional ArsR family regulator